MKGVYLNDIPMDLFLKYFSKEDLVDKDLEPSLLPDFRTFYKYSFTISSQTRFLYSLFTISQSARIREEIILDLQELYENTINTSDITNLTLSATLQNQPVYLQTNRPALNNQRYMLQKIDEQNGIFYFIEVDGTLNGDLTDSNEIDIKDTRTNSNIYSFEVDIKRDTSAQVIKYDVYETGTTDVVGYIYEHTRNFIQELNNLGKPLFLNEFGTKTTSSKKESSFLRHNNAIRKGFNNIMDPLDMIVLKFRPSLLGVYKKGSEDKLVYYENFTRTFSYEKVDFSSIPSGTSTDSLRISSDIKNGVSSQNPLPYLVQFRESKLKETLNLFDVKRVKVIKDGDFYESINAAESVYIGDRTVFVDMYEKKLKYRDVSYSVFKLPNNSKEYVKFSGISDLSTLNLEIVSLLGINYVRLPVLSGNKIVFDSNKFVRFGNNETSVTFEFNRYKIEPGIPNNSVYSRGFILYRVELFFDRVPDKISLFGNVSDLTIQNGFSKFKLSKYIPESSSIAPIGITDEYFDLNGFTAVGNTFEKVYYIQDEIDNTYFLKVTEVISKDVINTTFPRTEFLDFFHIKRTSNVGANTFPLPDGSFISRARAVSWPVTESTLRELFENYRVVDGFYNNRGPYISDKVFLNSKRDAITTMSSDFLNRSSEFFSVENIFYDESSTTIKMRVYSESFKNVISNNNFLYDTILKRTSDVNLLSKDDGKLILERTDEFATPNLIVKLYEPQELEKNKILAQSESNNLNSFQKLLDYETIPYNEKRVNIISEQKKREQIFLDKEATEESKDEIVIYNKLIKTNLIPRIIFKKGIISILTEFFFKNNTYLENNNFYINSYYNFYKQKMDGLNPVYTLRDFVPTYKKIYDKKSLDSNINDIFDKVLKKSETWRVL